MNKISHQFQSFLTRPPFIYFYTHTKNPTLRKNVYIEVEANHMPWMCISNGLCVCVSVCEKESSLIWMMYEI